MCLTDALLILFNTHNFNLFRKKEEEKKKQKFLNYQNILLPSLSFFFFTTLLFHPFTVHSLIELILYGVQLYFASEVDNEVSQYP